MQDGETDRYSGQAQGTQAPGIGGGLLTTQHNRHYLVDAVWQKVPDVKFSQF